MPVTPAKPCRYPGCPGFCKPGEVFCKDHIMWSTDRVRGGATVRRYDSRWRKARKTYLEKHPLCAVCFAKGKLTPATVIDHIVPHRGDPRLFWDEKTGSPFARTAMIRRLEAGIKLSTSMVLQASMPIKLIS